MKLASLRSRHNRDGELLVIDRQLQWAVKVSEIAPTLQNALDHWTDKVSQLEEISALLNDGKLQDRRFAIETTDLLSPLPRCYNWVDGSAYVNHVELVRKARGATMPDNFWTDPLVYQGGGDDFLAPNDNIECLNDEWGIDFEAEVAVITDRVPMGTSAEECKKHIKLIMLVNDVSLRNLIPDELAKSFGFYQSKPATAFSPVAITPDELESAWDGAKVHLPLTTHYKSKLFGEPLCHVDMTFDFPTLISHAAKTRNLGAGCIVGSGTISNYDRSRGSSCLAELRTLEKINTGNIVTPFMKDGDTVRIEMFNEQKESLFGAIYQKVKVIGQNKGKH